MQNKYGERFVVLFIKYVFKKGLSDVDTSQLLTYKIGVVYHHNTIKYWRLKLTNQKIMLCKHNWKTKDLTDGAANEVYVQTFEDHCLKCGKKKKYYKYPNNNQFKDK